MKFKIEKKLRNALGRAGILSTPHGDIETPAFVAVGTKATVKALTPEQLREIGVQVVLGNTYHLYLEPGTAIVEQAGGLGKFMGWNGPTMTDSGGFQVFSLGAGRGRKASKISSGEVQPRRAEEEEMSPLVAIDDEGVTFKSYKDGSTHRFTPERSIEIQHDIGADIIFAFDECTSPEARKDYQKTAMERTHAWARRSLIRHRELSTHLNGLADRGRALFGIVQGGRHEDLRRESARIIGGMEFDGFGIGGSFAKEDMYGAVRVVNELLPEERPRHLLGIGEPMDLFAAVENGCDLFDCVAPTRQARTGSLYTRVGRISITNTEFRGDFSPVDKDCRCYTCTHFTRAYLAHLFRSDEILANTLATIHNVFFIVQLVKNMRKALLEGTFYDFRDAFISAYHRTARA